MNQADQTILKIEHVGKDYILGAVTGDTFKDAIKARRAKRKGEDLKHPVHNQTFTALNDVSFEVKRGETIGLIGSNGAGKSTLLKLISRITAPTRGKIYIDGKVASMLEVGTGFHPELTGRENIYLNGSILGMSREEIDKKIDSIIEFSEVADFIDTPVKRYSSGMYVKLAFSVSAHLDSDIMIMDEVLAVGDIKFQHKCLNKMKEIAEKEGRTILYVSHNMDTIHKLCKRCIVLNHGNIVFDGDVDEATKLYLGVETKTSHTADFTKYLRPGWLGRDDVRLTWADYLEKEDNVVEDDDLNIRIRYKKQKEVDHVGMRVELMDNEEKPFATQVYYDVIHGQVDEENEIVLNLNLSNVKNGIYQNYYTVFAMDPYGNSIDLDCVRGIDIEIKRKEKEGELHWINSSWGNVELMEKRQS